MLRLEAMNAPGPAPNARVRWGGADLVCRASARVQVSLSCDTCGKAMRKIVNDAKCPTWVAVAAAFRLSSAAVNSVGG